MNRAEKRRRQKLAKKASKSNLTTRSHINQTPSVNNALKLAIQQHNAGDLIKAKGLYQQILQAEPNHPIALQLLGVVALQVGETAIGADLISKAVAIKPDYAEAHSNLGNALRGLGKLDEAVASCQKALAINPNFIEAHNNLGNALKDQGKLDKAVASYRKALAINPNFIEAHNNLGNALREQGKLDEAVTCYRKALAINPGYAEAHSNLGNALKDLGKLDEAVASCQKALAINPNSLEAHYNLGNALIDQGEFDEAVASYRKALAINPDYAQAHNYLGNALKGQGELDEAIASYRMALTISPGFAEAHNNLGNALKDQGEFDEAIASYRMALTINPGFAEAHNNLGNALRDLGELDEAIVSYRMAITLKPDYAGVYRHLAATKKFTQYDNDIKAMEDMYASSSLSDEKRMHFAFGLGKVFEDIKCYEKAFEYLTEGNALKRKEYDYSGEDTASLFNTLKTTFDASLFAKHQGSGCHDKTPIFILGMPRSGTTLIEQILSSHPEIYGAGELKTLYQIAASHFNTRDGAISFKSIEQINGSELEHLGDEYIRSIRKHSNDTHFITDKMPGNFKYIGLIKLILPQAKIIHCQRDPVDTCLSIFKNYFSGTHEYAYNLGELGCYYNSYRDLMKHWHKAIPDFIHDIKYEDIITDQVGQTKALLKHCGLEWDDACLEYYKTDRPVQTASSAQVRSPIYSDSVRLWKRYEKQLEPLIEALQL